MNFPTIENFPDDRAKMLKADWIDETVPRSQKIDLGIWSGEIGAIKGIWIEGDLPKKVFSEMAKDISHEYHAWRRDSLTKSAPEKALSTSFFELIYWTFTRDNPTEEIKAKAVRIQESFFVDHPRRCIPDPSLFKEIIPPVGQGLTIFQDAGLRFISQCVQKDMISSGE